MKELRREEKDEGRERMKKRREREKTRKTEYGSKEMKE